MDDDEKLIDSLQGNGAKVASAGAKFTWRGILGLIAVVAFIFWLRRK